MGPRTVRMHLLYVPERPSAARNPMSLPPLILRKNEDRRLRAGHLWVFSNEVDIARTPLKAYQPGDLVEIQSSNGHAIGSGYVNPNSLIAARILSRDPQHLPD